MRQRSATKAFITIAATLLVMAVGQVAGAATLRTDEHFSVKEYNLFHDILHPLEHEALPKQDFKTIRERAGELATRGHAIVKLGVPAGVQERAEFEKELKNFETALVNFTADAEKGTNGQLKESYSAVHDTFEMLASMLPRK